MNLTGVCETDLHIAFSAPFSENADATGRPGAGILQGAGVWLGSYDQCMAIPTGRYCLVDMATRVGEDKEALAVRWGLCAVQSCNDTAIELGLDSIIKVALPNTKMTFENASVHCTEDLAYSEGFYGTIGVFGALMFLTLLGTMVEAFVRHRRKHCPKLVHRIDESGPCMVGLDSSPLEAVSDEDELVRPPRHERLAVLLKQQPGPLTRLFSSISLPASLGTLCGEPQPSSAGVSPALPIPCLHGVKVLSMAWIILAHTGFVMFSTNAAANPKEFLSISNTLPWQPVSQAYFATDTFFCISGLLTTYLTLYRMQNNGGKLNLIKFYLHRYLRLTPVLVLVMLVWMFVKPHVATGPLWFSMRGDEFCERHWWSNLLYVANFYPTSPKATCMGWLWYVMLEWQFYLVSPVFIYTLYHYPRAGLSVTGAVIGASVVVTAALIGSFNIDVNLTATTINRNLEASEEYLRLVVTKPYCRAASYLVGVGGGYVLYREQGHRTRRIPKVCVVVLWGCLLAASAGLPLCPPPPPGGSTAPLYVVLAPAAWAVAAATLGYLCCHGYAGVVGGVLSWRGWAPLSRLSYAVYMLHPLVTSVLCYSTKTAVYVSTATIMMYFTCTLVLSYIGAFVLCLLVEIPVAKVEAFFSK